MLSSAASIQSTQQIKCYHRKCKVTTPLLLIKCSKSTCDKKINLDCYKQHILQHHNIDHFNVDHPNSVACTKAHHGHLLKQFVKASNPVSKRNVPWNEDGKFGPDDPNTSESISIVVVVMQSLA